MRRIAMIFLAGIFVVLCTVIHQAQAGEIDILLQKLVEKGILTSGEAQQIGTETKEQVKKEIAEGKSSSLPQWVQNTKLKGDFRLRYQWDKDKGQTDQSRARIRPRLGLESKINDKLTMGIGIATGKASDPRTRNVTLGNDANATNTPGSAKTIVLDYAYAQYMPRNGITIIGGKFQNPLWKAHDLFWDDNITPEGLGLKLSRKLNSKLELFMNGLFYWMKNDSRSDKLVALLAPQVGANFSFNDNTAIKGAVTYNKFTGVKNAPKFASASSSANSFNAAGNYAYNYDTVQPAVELFFKQPFHGLLPFASIFGEYMYNTSLPSGATGAGAFDVGIKFGCESVSDAKQWQARLVYSKLGRDAWLDILTDADRYYPGKANSKAYEAILDYGLGKNTWLRLDYYYAESLSQGINGRAPEHTLQIDWNMKF